MAYLNKSGNYLASISMGSRLGWLGSPNAFLVGSLLLFFFELILLPLDGATNQ
jgi:hypothetical protein